MPAASLRIPHALGHGRGWQRASVPPAARRGPALLSAVLVMVVSGCTGEPGVQGSLEAAPASSAAADQVTGSDNGLADNPPAVPSGDDTLATLPLAGQPCAGYTLIGSPGIAQDSDNPAILVDMVGNEVHRWPITGFPPKMLPGGSLLGCTGIVEGSYDCVQAEQVSWDGEIEWSFSNWEDMDGQAVARHHHDLQRQGNPLGFYAPGQEFLDDGNTLILGHQRTTVSNLRPGALDDDVIYQVDFTGQLTGFEWHGTDHVAEFGLDDAALEDIRTRTSGLGYLEWLHGNSMSRLGPNHWYDEGHAEFHPDNIMYSSRQANFVVIIDHDSGNVVWRIGPDFAGRPEEQLGQFVGQHMPHIIPRGLPGAGNVLVLDNGGTSGWGGNQSDRYARTYSRVLEFNPLTMQVVWQYGSPTGDDYFYSPLVGDAQRLPNGNTLITIGTAGQVIEVTEAGDVVWSYQFAPASTEPDANWIYRAYRVPPEWLPAGENDAHGAYAAWSTLFE